MTTRSEVQSAIRSVREDETHSNTLTIHIDRATLSVLVEAAESARYKSITGKPVTDPVYESPSDVLEGAL